MPEDWLGDIDSDELFDIYEKVIDTDPFNPDTDSDELPDGYEVLALATDPLEVDTDLNGIWDKDEDFDSDNLSNLGEYQNGTNPMKPDTDNDGLLDGEEGYNGTIYEKYGIYFDPLIPDTDNDGVLDGDEIFGQSKEQQVQTHDGAIASVSVNMNTNGNIERNLNIDSKMGIDMMTSNTLGLIGEPFDFATSSSFESATIKFTIDKTKLYIPEFSNLIVMWYDEENQEFVECNSENGFEFVRNSGDSSLTVTTSHFSQYIVVDSKAWYQAWEDSSQRIRKYYIGNSSHQSTVSYNTVFAIDTSGSMTDDPQGRWVGYDPIIRTWEVGKNGAPPLPKVNSTFEGNQLRQQYLANYGFNTCRRITACESFIDVMHSNDKAAILTFANDSKVLSPLTNSKETLINALQDITDGGGTCFSEAINRSIELLGEANPASLNNIHRILLLSDGVPEPENDTEEAINAAIESAKEKNIQIYTFGLGVGSGDDKLEEIAERTNGKFYKVITPSELTRKVGEVTYQNPDLGELNDEDDDGIPDIIEICGLRPNGQPIGSDPELKDTDFDGLEDGTEVLFASAELTAYIENGKFSQGIKLKSDPLKPDSDDDGLLDGKPIKVNGKIIAPKDNQPLKVNGPEGVWKEQIRKSINGEFSSTYDNNSKTVSDLANEVAGEMPAYINGYINATSAKAANAVIDFALSKRDTLLENKDEARIVALLIKEMLEESVKIAEKEGIPAQEYAAAVGAYLLDFKYDEENIAYHSSASNWQRDFGYNDLYDDIFKIGSYMLPLKFNFSYGGKEHVLWAWKGDYWNLGSGTEVGLYSYNRTVDGTDHYDVVDFELPMTINLYNYYSKDNIENVFCWLPNQEQWWITGFNPNFTSSDPEIMVTLGSVDFTGHEDMYDALKRDITFSDNSELKDSITFDDDNYTAWILWG